MLSQPVNLSQRIVPFALNCVAKSGTCQNVQSRRKLVSSVACSLHHQDQGKLYGRNRLEGGRRWSTTEAPKGERRIYKLMKIKAKDLEKVDPDVTYGGLDPSTVRAGFEESKELQDANDIVKQIFSLQTANQKQIIKKQVKLLNEKIQLVPDKENKLSTKVIRQTVLIRHLSKTLQTYQSRKDVGSKVTLVHMLDRRRKNLKLLRRENFAQFEMCLKELGIEFIPIGKYDHFPQSKRMREKQGVLMESWAQRKEALDQYMTTRRESQLMEIAQLKKDLGMEMTEEEKERLQKAEEEHN